MKGLKTPLSRRHTQGLQRSDRFCSNWKEKKITKKNIAKRYFCWRVHSSALMLLKKKEREREGERELAESYVVAIMPVMHHWCWSLNKISPLLRGLELWKDSTVTHYRRHAWKKKKKCWGMAVGEWCICLRSEHRSSCSISYFKVHCSKIKNKKKNSGRVRSKN